MTSSFTPGSRAVSGQFELDLPPRKAIELFTPEGERAWAPGWDPTYASGEPSQSPGTVFITDHGGVETIRLIQSIDVDECAVAYSKVTPGQHAGTVRVRCEDAQGGRSVVSVSYDMSLLPGSDGTELDPYDDRGFEAMLDHWSHAIAASLGR